MSGSPVFVTGRLGTPDLSRFKSLVPEAVTRAIRATQRDLQRFLKDPSIIPRDTGRLQNQVVSFVSPGQITFQWSAVDPISGFDYASLRDQIGGKIAPANFSGRILQIAKEILINHLRFELQAIAP